MLISKLVKKICLILKRKDKKIMSHPDNSISRLDYHTISISEFFRLGKKKINQIIKSSRLNNIEFIKTQGNFIYHLRHLKEDIHFNNTKWFVHNPNDLLVVFMYRLWENDCIHDNLIDIDTYNFYKQNLHVDVYYTKQPLHLLKFNNQSYHELENFIQCIDSKFKKCYLATNNNYCIANWVKEKKDVLKLDGWLEQSNDKFREENFKRIDEIMLLPSSQDKLDLVYSERIDKIVNFDNQKIILSK